MTYSTIKEIGRGHFGRVDLEWDDYLERYCAAKYVELVPTVSRPFDEAKSMVAARHQNVVEVFSAELVGSIPVIRMEYLSNGSVAELYGGQPAPVADGMRHIADAARGIHYLHTIDLLHRDIKAANLLFGNDGEVKVADFGLAGAVHEARTLPRLGYHLTWPPENVKAGTFIDSPLGDVYSLGVTAYRLFNGDQALFAGIASPAELGKDIVKGAFPNRQAWLSHIHPALRRAVNRAISVDPLKRFSTAEDFRYALERALPAIGWAPTISAGQIEWRGATGAAEFTATLSPSKREFEFSMWISKRGNASRRHHADFRRGSLSDLMDHSHNVLSRIAVTGR